jgi:hypothetical protein
MRKAGVGVIIMYEPSETVTIEKVIAGGPLDQQHPGQVMEERI